MFYCPFISKGYLSLLNFFTQKLIEKPRNFFKITANFYHFLILITGYFYVKSLFFSSFKLPRLSINDKSYAQVYIKISINMLTCILLIYKMYSVLE